MFLSTPLNFRRGDPWPPRIYCRLPALPLAAAVSLSLFSVAVVSFSWFVLLRWFRFLRFVAVVSFSLFVSVAVVSFFFVCFVAVVSFSLFVSVAVVSFSSFLWLAAVMVLE